MNVYPRKPLEAYEKRRASPWAPWVIWDRAHTDAEFAEHFYPAERLDTLIAAVEAWEPSSDPGGNLAEKVRAAFRAFREQVTA